MTVKVSGMSGACAIVVAALATGAMITDAVAQERLDAGAQGFFGGYSSFGGYYDTYGTRGFGGNSGYGTYRRTDTGVSNNAATIVTVPVSADAPADTCDWLRHRAKTTHSRKWYARYAACRREKN